MDEIDISQCFTQTNIVCLLTSSNKTSCKTAPVSMRYSLISHLNIDIVYNDKTLNIIQTSLSYVYPTDVIL